MVIFCFSEEVCPYGDRTEIPRDREEFQIETPPGTTPNELIDGSIPFGEDDKIVIKLANEPKIFLLIDLQYYATVPTKVRIVYEDENIPPLVKMVS